MTEYSEHIETPEEAAAVDAALTDADRADLEQLEAGVIAQPEFHPILEIWRAQLAPAAEFANEKVTPQYASKLIASYPGLGYADAQVVQDRYYGKLAELLEILNVEIASDDECLTYRDPAEDAVENAEHYKNLLLQWQLAFRAWEQAWSCTDESAAAEVAAISEVYKIMFGQTGMTAFLDNIGFEFTEADQEQLREALDEFRLGE